MTEFKKQFRGYNKEQVELTIKLYEEKIASMQNIIDSLNQDIDHLNQQNALLNHRVSIIEKTNEEIARLALKEASELIDKAKRNADMILKESLEYVRGLSNEVGDFKEQAIKFKTSVQKMSKDIIDTIDNSEVFHLINEEKNKNKDRESL